MSRGIQTFVLMSRLGIKGLRHLTSRDMLVERALNFDLSKIPKFNQQQWLEFDFDYLQEVEESLSGLPRRKILSMLANDITKDANTDIAAYEALNLFCQIVSKNFVSRQPVYPDKIMVSDPLLLLHMNEMRCGHIARVAADLANELGWSSRLVQLAGHVVAEVCIRDRWMLIDADLFAGGDVALLDSGQPGSVAELSHEAESLDRLFTHADLTLFFQLDGGLPNGFLYPSRTYFSDEAYGESKPVYYVKDKDWDPEDPYFGWHNYEEQAADDIQTSVIPARYTPGAPEIISIEQGPTEVVVRWTKSGDPSGILDHYKIYLNSISRGWNYYRYLGWQISALRKGPETTLKELQDRWVAPGQMSEDYYARALGPIAHDVCIESNEAEISIPLETVERAPFLTVCAVDSYGLKVGRRRWPVSPEYYIM